MNTATTTSFGRHAQELEGLEALLGDAELPQHNALVIGAGLDSLICAQLMSGSAMPQYDKWLQKPHNWEYLEVAAMLIRLGKPWSVTVVDSAAEVCDAVLKQKEVVIEGFDGQVEYANRFLNTLGYNGNGSDYGMLEAVKAALHNKKIMDRLALVRVMEIPSLVQERVTVLHGSVENLPEQVQQRKFEIVTIFKVLMHLLPRQRYSAFEALRRVVAEGGLIASSDLSIDGLQTVRSFNHRVWNYDSEGNAHLSNDVTYLSIKPLGSESKLVSNSS